MRGKLAIFGAAALYSLGWPLSKAALKKLDFWNTTLWCDFGILVASVLIFCAAWSVGYTQPKISVSIWQAFACGVVFALGGFLSEYALSVEPMWYTAGTLMLLEVALITTYGILLLGEVFRWTDALGLILMCVGALLLFFRHSNL